MIRKPMFSEVTWQEFADAGLFWWVNRVLHLFGWAIVHEQSDNGDIVRVYPARCRARGFDASVEAAGFEKLTNHLNGRMPDLMEDFKDG